MRLSARKGTLRVHGKRATLRELPIHPQLRTDLQLWLDERPDWPGAQTTPALLLNRRGTRLIRQPQLGCCCKGGDGAVEPAAGRLVGCCCKVGLRALRCRVDLVIATGDLAGG